RSSTARRSVLRGILVVLLTYRSIPPLLFQLGVTRAALKGSAVCPHALAASSRLREYNWMLRMNSSFGLSWFEQPLVIVIERRRGLFVTRGLAELLDQPSWMRALKAPVITVRET